MAAAAIALIAGASGDVALRLGLGMLGLQFAIGAANEVADEATDAVGNPAKPIPAGAVPRGLAVAVSVVAAAVGLLFAATVAVGALIVGIGGLADGLIYDLRLKRTPFAWVPFAAGVGLLPLYAWWGARGTVPVAFLAVMGLAVVAGAMLALANAYADIDKDRVSGITSAATLLGGRRTLAVDAALMLFVQLIACATTVGIGGSEWLLLVEVCGSALGWFGIGIATVLIERLRPLVWEIQGVAVLILGTAWLVALNSAGALRS